MSLLGKIAEIVENAQETKSPTETMKASTNSMNAQGVSSLLDREGYEEGGEIIPEQETHTMPDGTVMPGATHEEYEKTMAEESMVPDEEMETEYIDFIMNEALIESEQNYLMEKLSADPQLSEIFDKVVEVASEYSGSGPVEGPGSGISDSIPARLSDGEFVITAKATEEIGPDNLDRLMGMAEENANNRKAMRDGGQPVNTGLLKNSYEEEEDLGSEQAVSKQMLEMNPRLYINPRLL